MIVMALVFAIIGCDIDLTDDDNIPKTLVIQDIPADVYAYGESGGQIGLFTAGTTLQNVLLSQGIIAEANLSNSDIVDDSDNSDLYSLTIPLYFFNSTNPWTGRGIFDIYVILLGDDGHYYKAGSINIISETTTILFSNLKEVFPTSVLNKTPAASDYTVSGTGNFSFDGYPKEVTVTPKNDASLGTVTVKYNDSVTAPSDIGVYSVTFDVAEAPGWDPITGLYAGIVNIMDNRLQTPSLEDFDIVGLPVDIVEGDPTPTVSITAKPGKTTGNITIIYTNMSSDAAQNTFPTVAGTYDVTFDVAAVQGWNAITGLFAGQVNITDGGSAPVNKTPAPSDYEVIGERNVIFDGSPKTISITKKDTASPGEIIVIKYNGQPASSTYPSDVGLYTITIDVAAAPGWDAVNGLLVAAMAISYPNLQNPMFDDFIITGLPQTVTQGNLPNPAISITAKPGKTTGNITIFYGHTDTFPTAVGTYAVTFSVAEAPGWNAVNGLYAGIVIIQRPGESTQVIATKFSDFDVTIGDKIFTQDYNSSAPVEVVYTGSAQEVIITAKVGTTYPVNTPGLVTYKYYDIKGATEQRLEVAPTDVGRYRVDVYLTPVVDTVEETVWAGTEFNLWFNITN